MRYQRKAASGQLRRYYGGAAVPRTFSLNLFRLCVEDNLSDYLHGAERCKAGSFLEELDDTSLEAWLKTTLKSSVLYGTLPCGV